MDQFITTTNAISRYAGQTCTDPQYTRIDIDKLDDVMLRIPDNQEDVDDDVSNLLIGKYMDTYINRRQLFRQNKAILYSVVLRQ